MNVPKRAMHSENIHSSRLNPSYMEQFEIRCIRVILPSSSMLKIRDKHVKISVPLSIHWIRKGNQEVCGAKSMENASEYLLCFLCLWPVVHLENWMVLRGLLDWLPKRKKEARLGKLSPPDFTLLHLSPMRTFCNTHGLPNTNPS